MKLFGDRTIRERITKLSEYISFCWAFLYCVSKEWKITKEEINTNSQGHARGGGGGGQSVTTNTPPGGGGGGRAGGGAHRA